MFFRILLLSQFFSHFVYAQTCKDYSNLVVFGDSLSDVGNACSSKTSSPNMFCPLYAHKKFSDGQLWIEHLARHLYLPMIASSSGGYNYAHAGATSDLETDVPSLRTQVKNYLQRETAADPDALYVLWIGGNDFKNAGMNLSFLNQNSQIFYVDILENLEFSVNELYEKGARHFLIPNLPPLHEAPILQNIFAGGFHSLFQDLNMVFATMIQTYNLELKKRLDILTSTHNDSHIIHPNIYSLFHRMSHTKGLFCFDQFHPSALAHKIIASKIAELYF